MTPKRNADETPEARSDQEADDEMDRVLALSPEEQRRELGAAGFEAAAADVTAEALYHRAQRGAPTGFVANSAEPVHQVPREGRRRVLRSITLLAAVLALASFVFVFPWLTRRARLTGPEITADSSSAKRPFAPAVGVSTAPRDATRALGPDGSAPPPPMDDEKPKLH